MNWHNVRLIWARETRDQLRDRRMLFMICVLPILLYPLLGTTFMQLAQFMRKHESTVLIVGAEQLRDAPTLPPLIENGRFAADLFAAPHEAQLLHVEEQSAEGKSEADVIAEGRRELIAGTADTVVYFPDGFAEKLARIHQRLQNREPADTVQSEPVEELKPIVLFHSPREASPVAKMRVDRAIDRWMAKIVERNLRESHVPINITQPFELESIDVAGREQKQAALYSKLLPFIVFLWALTGAFYPAVDLCAGEKERGTLEALLASPAQRSEIVWGKLLTVMLFSVFTALLNLASMGFTAAFVVRQMSAAVPGGASLFAMPPLISIFWIVLALLPISALFSALSLACAAFARSTKEGQYYFMPLFMITLPLMLAPMSPGTELNLGNSLIPVTGLSFLLRGLMEGDYQRVVPFVLPVVVVTLGCCWLAVRWAIELFNQESVLFRENERFELRAWLIHLVRDRKATPSVGAALACVAIIFLVKFFAGLALTSLPSEPHFGLLVQVVLITQLCIVVPALAMAFLFTRNPQQSLLLAGWPRPATLLAAVALAVAFFPVGLQVGEWIRQLYPIDMESLADSPFAQLLQSSPSLWKILLLMALLPAVCEELAFRGFVLSGLRHLGHKWWAIVLTAVLFGMAHTALLQQSLAAAVTGVLIGYIAVQSGHLAPCILFHFAYNGLSLTLGHWGERLTKLAESKPLFDQFFQPTHDRLQVFSPAVVVTGGLVTLALLWWFHRLDSPKSAEERLTEARLQPVQRPLAQDLS
ncbi:MAG: ABC transporter permease subunit/CPBP intramembrane protease [Pirellulales bacterium]